MSVPKHGMPSGTFNPQFNMIFNNSDLGKNHLYITVIIFFCSNMIPTHLFCNTFKMSDTCINMTNRVGGMHVMVSMLFSTTVDHVY
jgi:hypothetical protein